MARINKRPEVCVKVDDVGFKYNSHYVLEGITFEIHTGDYIGIIGPNGGGKSTLLKLILGLLKPSDGTITLFGHEAAAFKDRELIGYVSQKTSQSSFEFPATVEEVVASGRTANIGLFHRYGREDHQAVEEAMQIADITKYRRQLVSRLSGGERQRVFIARALAGKPKMLVLDEPSVGVDIPSQEMFYAFLSDINKNLGITIVFVSHDIDVIAHEVHYVLCINHSLLCHGAPEDFIKDEFLERIYGKKVKHMLHEHMHHEHI